MLLNWFTDVCLLHIRHGGRGNAQVLALQRQANQPPPVCSFILHIASMLVYSIRVQLCICKTSLKFV